MSKKNEKYIYNEKTHTLHIRGFCCHTKGNLFNQRSFPTEDAAISYAGRHISTCKICFKKREQLMQ